MNIFTNRMKVIGGALGVAAIVTIGYLSTGGQYVPGGGGGTSSGISAVVADTPLSGSGSAGSHLKLTDGTENGQSLAWNGTVWGADTACGNPSKRYCYKEEFEGGYSSPSNCASSQSMIGAVTGAATCTYGNVTGGSGHPGLLSISTGTNATGGGRLFAYGSNTGVYFGGGAGVSCSSQLVSFANVSTSVIEFLWRSGFTKPNSNADSADAVELNYDRARAVALVGGGGNFWIAETASSSTRTEIVLDGSTQGGVTTVAQTVTAGTWYTLTECVNAAATSTTFYVNGVLSATITTNIPSGTSHGTNPGLQCFNNSGSVPASQVCNVDYVTATLPFGVAR